MFRSQPGMNRRQGGIHLPMMGDNPGNERREGEVEEEPPLDPPRDPRPPAAGMVTLESLAEIVEGICMEILMRLERVEARLEARLDEHEAQLHQLNSNYVR